tara:strand:- start:357 stop:1040 length:684 start_codon:yes stop_codon:yes gene_type:complete
MDRVARRLTDLKQNKTSVSKIQPSLKNMREGQEILYQPKNKPLRRYRREGHILWTSDMTRDGNIYIEKKLTTNELKYEKKFTDYRLFSHNFNKQIDQTEYYFPWHSGYRGVDANMNTAATTYLAPYAMTLHKLFVRPANLDVLTMNLTFTLDKQDDGDITVDEVANFEYTDDLVDHTVITINKSDFNNNPTVEAGDKVGLSITADANPTTGAIDWYITSVWEVKITV